MVLALVLLLCGHAWAQWAGNASTVYGQLGDFTTNTANIGSGTSLTATGINGPRCVRVDVSGSTYVCDSRSKNNRVVQFAPGQPMSAVAVWGRPDLTTGKGTTISPPTASSFDEPYDVGLYDGGLFVVDFGNNRVLYFASGQVRVLSESIEPPKRKTSVK
jgi:hypothetical protein